MGELFKEIKSSDGRYGIAHVQPDRASKKCRIRNLNVEYILTKVAIILVPPKACLNCERQGCCVDGFVEQIVEKYNVSHKDSGEYYL